MLEEARMLSNAKDLIGSVEMLEKMPKSNLQQVRALHCFEMAMCYMFLHRYPECSAEFHKVSKTEIHISGKCGQTNDIAQMVGLNNWSHGLYYYISACCHVELYRELLATDPTKAVSGNSNPIISLVRY
jgi:hypothetical protein